MLQRHFFAFLYPGIPPFFATCTFRVFGRNSSCDVAPDSSLHPPLLPTISLTQLLPISTIGAQGRKWSLEGMKSVFYTGGFTLRTGILALLYLPFILGTEILKRYQRSLSRRPGSSVHIQGRRMGPAQREACRACLLAASLRPRRDKLLPVGDGH